MKKFVLAALFVVTLILGTQEANACPMYGGVGCVGGPVAAMGPGVGVGVGGGGGVNVAVGGGGGGGPGFGAWGARYRGGPGMGGPGMGGPGMGGPGMGGPGMGGPGMGGFGPMPGYGRFFGHGMGVVGVGHGAFGAARPAWFGPVGRYPKLWFAAPLRRSLGLPGFTPLRQFALGRGHIRRMNRRAGFFGRGFMC